MQMLIRFLVGGTLVSLFALLGDALRPKGFAGLFAAAPSVAMASLGLAVLTEGTAVASMEARSMLGGEIAFGVYALCCVYSLAVKRSRALPTTLALLVVWFSVAAGIYLSVLKP